MMMKKPKGKTDIRFAFFGTPELAAVILDELEAAGYVPALVVSQPDRPQGRGLALLPTPVKAWAQKRNIPALQPESFDNEFLSALKAANCDIFIVIYYGKVLPRSVLDIPKRGALNVHFSLLPRLRGTSPVRSAILNDERDTGTSIILLDEQIDHGPVIAQKKIAVPTWPPKASELEELSTRGSARLLIQILPDWIAGEIEGHEQNHDVATYCPKLIKEDGLLDLVGDAYQNLLKIKALDTTIGTHAFFERPSAGSKKAPKKIRVNIIDAHLEPPVGGRLVIDRVKPEGKREMSYDEFVRSGARPTSHYQT